MYFKKLRLFKPVRFLYRKYKYIFRDRNPLQLFDDYDKYWEKRKEDGTENKIFNRFLVAADYIKDKKDSILDVGCGSGSFLSFLHEEGYSNLSGYDIIDSLNENTRDYLKDYHFSVDLSDLSGINRRYDIATALQVLEHVQNAEELVFSLLRVAKGKIIVSIPNFGYWQHRLRCLFGKFPNTGCVYHIREHVRFWTHKEFLEWARYYDLKILGYRASLPFNSGLAKAFPGLFGKQIVYVIDARKY